MTSTPTTYVAPGGGARYRMPDGDHVAKALITDALGTFEVLEVEAPEQPAAPPHISPWTGFLYLLEGRISVLVGDTTHELEPGAAAVLPAGTACTFTATGGTARFLAITSGERAGRFFADFGATVPADQPLDQVLPHLAEITPPPRRGAARHPMTRRTTR